MKIAKQIHEFLFGQKSDVALPEHVQHAIQQQQLTSEKLISWIQLVIVMTFSVLYFASPKTFSTDAKFAPVPWALSAYFIFSILRLFLSYRSHLPNWVSFISIIVDIALLVTLIWSFHLQYQQPASFYLKAPTLLYLFIFIALRTLRFEAKFVLTVGMVAAFGWLSLLTYALVTSGPGTVTRNYVLYMTSNHILIGGEIDKIISILMVTAILALAVSRGQRLLEQAVAETAAIKDLSKFFVPEIATTIIQSGQKIKPGYGELRHVAILHCDIRDFTEMTKHSTPQQIIKLLTEYQSRMVKIIRDHNGSVDKFIGDGILASFNAIKPNTNYLADAMQAAIEIISENKTWTKERKAANLNPIRVGVSITSGSVILGIVGDASRLEYTVIGDPVNIAVKLDKHCKIENCQVLTTEEAFNAAIKQGFQPKIPVERFNGRQVEGIIEPINLVVLER